MELYKFIDKLTKKSVYLRLDKLIGLKEAMDGSAELLIEGGWTYCVEEHFQYVLAILQDRDPNPSKILYGK